MIFWHLGQSGTQKWHVPITYVTSKDLRRTNHYLLISKNASMNIEGEWFKFNVDASGYYIVNYDVKNWNRIIRQLRDDHKVFSGLDRASIVKDVFTLAEEELLPFEVALNATIYLEKVSLLFLFLSELAYPVLVFFTPRVFPTS